MIQWRAPKINWLQSTKTLFAFGVLALGAAGTLAFADTASAHGYIEAPASRAYLCKLQQNKGCGAVQYEPQSVETKGNFPDEGPADGKLASGGIFLELDEQTPTRWKKVDMNTGKNTFTWYLTAPHSTKEWKYYITKKDWDPSQPLKRSDLELIAKIEDGGKKPDKSTSHEITIPADRTGYHVLLGVWEIADTPNAFYQVVDLNLRNGGQVQPPAVPTQLISPSQTDKSVTLSWLPSSASQGIKHYEIFRNGTKVGTSTAPSYTDSSLKPSTAYTYTVVAVDQANNRSGASAPLIVTTKGTVVDHEAPSVPTNVVGHPMETGIHLMWKASSDNVGVVKYDIYRDGKLVGSSTTNSHMDEGLTQATTYSYTIVAVDGAGNRSNASAPIRVTTKEGQAPGEYPAWDKTKVYLAGDRADYNGVTYEAKWWTQGNQPDKSEAWKLVSNVTLEWSSDRAYVGGDVVGFDGKQYRAKWWTKGEKPSTSSVWVLVP